jgi:hypothetical protein
MTANDYAEEYDDDSLAKLAKKVLLCWVAKINLLIFVLAWQFLTNGFTGGFASVVFGIYGCGAFCFTFGMFVETLSNSNLRHYYCLLK